MATAVCVTITVFSSVLCPKGVSGSHTKCNILPFYVLKRLAENEKHILLKTPTLKGLSFSSLSI